VSFRVHDPENKLNGRAAWATWKVGPPSRNDDPTRPARDQEDEELARSAKRTPVVHLADSQSLSHVSSRG
jgi:hypothetical protein